MHALPVYDNKYIKTKKRSCGDKVYNNFRGLNEPEDGAECESFTVISIDSLLVYGNKYYLEVYLDNCAYKTVDCRLVDQFNERTFNHKEFYSVLLNNAHPFYDGNKRNCKILLVGNFN